MTPIIQRWLPILLPGFMAALLITQILFSGTVPDNQDLWRYFESSAWVSGEGQLYVSIFSEYPLLANLLFGIVRALSRTPAVTAEGFTGFAIYWVALAAITTGYTIHVMRRLVGTRFPARNLWVTLLAWLSPAVLFFALTRFDIYPALATLLMLVYLSRARYLTAAFWLGIAICLKGYALIFLPAISAFIYVHHGFSQTLRFCTLTLTLPLLSLLTVLSYGGWDAMLSPFLFHANRSYNADSLYLLVHALTKFNINEAPWHILPGILQLLFVIYPLMWRPTNFDDLVESLTRTITGVITFSVFYSPQFVIWLLPVASLSARRPTTVLTLLYALATTGYFMVASSPTPIALLSLISVLTLLRLALIGSTFGKTGALATSRHPSREDSTGLR